MLFHDIFSHLNHIRNLPQFLRNKVIQLFNKQNIYINYQYPDPAGIYYDIYDSTKWVPLIRKVSTDDNEKIDKQKDKSQPELWLQEIPVFYNFRNFPGPADFSPVPFFRRYR